MGMDLTGINNFNEYYTNHYFSSIFEENAADTISAWRNTAKETPEARTPWSLLRENSRLYYTMHDKYLRSRSDKQVLPMVRDLADLYLASLGYPAASPLKVEVTDDLTAPVYLEMKKPNGAPLLWVLLAHTSERDSDIMQGYCFDAAKLDDNGNTNTDVTSIENEELATRILFALDEPPRWLILIGLNQIALIDRNKWNEKRYLRFEMEEIFSRREESTFQAMAVLLHSESLCPAEGTSLLDKLDENSHRHAAGVSQDLKYALRESIEMLGNEVLYDMAHRLGRNFETDPVDASQLTIECLRYMYRMLFMLFIEARPELGYAPMKSQTYVQGYSLESLRDIADDIREETSEVGEGYYLHETISKLFNLIYSGYPESEAMLKQLAECESMHDVFAMEPLKAHIFDPEYTPLITGAKLRNCVLLKVIDCMSITRATGRRNDRRGRISYAALGVNQMGAVYEALLSYRGFIAEETLFEVKREQDDYNELDVGYFVPERELENYTEAERVRYDSGENEGKLRKHEKGTFIYRLAGREREKSASYYTPEVLTKCLVKYALKELLEGKTADEILQLTVCEPAMGSAAFLNEAINQLAEAYLDKKQKELDDIISYEDRWQELQRVKMYIADRNVYGIDLNPIAVELAEVSLWLNTIYKGGFVPWFGTQLVNGNSLIGARKQCYRVEQLQASRAPAIWYDNAPERIIPGEKRMPKKQIYHFLAGDPGMANYTDNVIKSLAPDKIQAMKTWNRSFVSPHSDEDIQTLLRLSAIIDDLWAKQVELRNKLNEQTADALSVYGHGEETASSHTSIREKDMILKRLYKSEEMENAGPYARLKFAMDYWCALWFWPIEKADLLPSRSEFLFDMSMILEGTVKSVTLSPDKNKNYIHGQMKLADFRSEMEEMADDLLKLYDDKNVVDLPALCTRNPRLELARQIADQNRFMHWELEFADLFEERGGFDLVIGNPPWIKMEWNEQAVLSDINPLVAIKNLSATQTARQRSTALADPVASSVYFVEYESMAGTQNYLNALQNYSDLVGMKVNLYKCFLPQAWQFCAGSGVSAFLHPDGVYDDPHGGRLREKLYPKLRRHYQFINEMKLFFEVHHNTIFSLNIYSNEPNAQFDTIANLFDASTVDECYVKTKDGPIPGIKNKVRNWNVEGHPGRVVRIGKSELELFAKIFDGSDNWKQARLPVLHAYLFLDVLRCFARQVNTFASLSNKVFYSQMWNETNAQKDNTIVRNVHFPESTIDMIYSGSHIGVANPIFKISRKVCRLNSDFDNIDLTEIPENYLQRCNYSLGCEVSEYVERVPITSWGVKCFDIPRIIMRNMFNQSGERTLISAIVPSKTGHVHAVFEIAFRDKHKLIIAQALMSSIPLDFYIKTLGIGSGGVGVVSGFPIVEHDDHLELTARALLLNSLTVLYKDLWKENWHVEYKTDSWSKVDPRLRSERFASLTSEWTWNTPLRSDYERRQALVEIDVLTAMTLGMTLDHLKTIYRLQFPILQQYEEDTWYDLNGRIVFTNNRSLTGVGFINSEWEQIKDAQSGTFTRTITDDTMPGGPFERTIEYVAPFDRCDREQDYETAWAFFESKYRDQKKYMG